MPFSVPLVLEKSLAVVHRLNPSATRSLQPAGQESGYDKDFREPITYDATRQGKVVRENARSELPAIRIPCQVEMIRFERLAQAPPGDDPQTGFTLVFHRMDLKRLKLIDKDTKRLLLKVNDRISAIESFKQPRVPTVHIDPPGLYIVELQPGSFGFGIDGTDLYLAYLSDRERVT